MLHHFYDTWWQDTDIFKVDVQIKQSTKCVFNQILSDDIDVSMILQ